MKWKILKKSSFWLLLIILLASFLRFAGLSWGLPYYFHPDEWNMAAAVAQLSWTNKLNPHFFAYGQFPLYLAYFSSQLYHLLPWINLSSIDLPEAIFFLRFWSALTGVGTVYLVYLITKRFLTTNYCLLATLLAALTPGLIQIAHFGTTESLLSFFFLAIIYFSLKIWENDRARDYLLAGVALGLAMGTKVSGAIFAFPLLLVFLFKLRQATTKKLLALLAAVGFFLISSPYVILNFPETKRILLYETQVASGEITVFYTRQFFKTLPVIFQLQKIFPYTLGWPIFIFGTAGWLISVVLITRAIKKRKILNFELQLLTLNFAFLTYFGSQAFLFTKWTRFMAPVFAFFPIFAAFLIQTLATKISNQKLLTACYLLLTTIAIVPGLVFSTLYFRPDIRFTASEWIYKNIPSGAKVLSETGNVIDLPFTWERLSAPAGFNSRPVSFDFYHLDEDSRLFPQLLALLENSDYIFVPSRRLFANHLRFPEKYPLTAKYYELLFSGKLGFTEIKRFQILPDESAEETWSVFDHPVVRIYQKKTAMSQKEYEELFNQP